MKNKDVSLKQAVFALERADNILILCHKNPDGDAWGSAFALYAALIKIGKRARVGGLSGLPPLYNYMGDFCRSHDGDFAEQFVVSVDCSNYERLIEMPAEPVDLAFDHHPTNTRFARMSLVEGDSAACCELIYRVISKLNVEIDKYIANCLYTGLSTDTGCFRYKNTTPYTLRLAARLIDAGADAGELNVRLFDTKTRARIELERGVMNSLRFFCGERVAVATISKELYLSSGAMETDLDGMTALPRSVEGVEFGITLKEQDGYYKGSVRTNDKSAADVAAHFGGGGHLRAAGFESRLPYDQIIAEAVAECEKQL